MVFDHMFSLIDSLSFSKKDENNTGIKPHKNKFKYPSFDTAFLVGVVLIFILYNILIYIKNRYKSHYRKKYTTVELREVSAQPFAPPKQIY